MSDSPVRLAVIGSARNIALTSELVRRLSGAVVSATGQSMAAAWQDGGDFDAVVVASLTDALYAAERGKHVLVDAPAVDSLSEAESLIRLCRAQEVVFAAGGLPRHAPACQTIIDRLAAGKLGDPGLLRVHRWRSGPPQSLTATLLGDLDLALHLFDHVPLQVHALGRHAHAYLQVHLGFPGGGMAILDFAQHLPTGQAYDSLSLIGSRGTAYADDHHNTHLLLAGEHPTALISESGTGALDELREFVHCVVHGLPPSVDGAAILAAHRVTDAIARSLDSAQVLHERGGEYEPA